MRTESDQIFAKALKGRRDDGPCGGRGPDGSKMKFFLFSNDVKILVMKQRYGERGTLHLKMKRK